MNIEDALAELGNQMSLENVNLDENNLCRLVFDKRLIVDFEAVDDGKTVHMYSVLCDIPGEERLVFYEKLLEANLFGQGTGGATFAIDPALGEVLMIKTLFMENMEYQYFVNALDTFLNHLEDWLGKLDQGDLLEDDMVERRTDSSFQDGLIKV